MYVQGTYCWRGGAKGYETLARSEVIQMMGCVCCVMCVMCVLCVVITLLLYIGYAVMITFSIYTALSLLLYNTFKMTQCYCITPLFCIFDATSMLHFYHFITRLLLLYQRYHICHHQTSLMILILIFTFIHIIDTRTDTFL